MVRIAPEVEIRRATTIEGIHAAAVAFDGPVRPEAADRFLRDPTHHLLVAYVDDRPAGMVSGVEVTHPDKGTEMFLYELGVAEGFRGQGVGAQLVTALADLARTEGCYGMWVLTDDANEAALRTYRSAGAAAEEPTRLLAWSFRPSADPSRA